MAIRRHEHGKPIVAKSGEDFDDWIEETASGGGLALAGWGFVATVAVVLAFASWQYAPVRSPALDIARTDGPDPSEVTGSIASAERGGTTVQVGRGLGAPRLAPLPLGNDETLATSRDVEALRSEIRDLQRRITQIGMSGDGVSRRIDRIEEKIAGTAPPDAPSPVAKAASPSDEPPADRFADRFPTPQPRPAVDPAAGPPAPGIDADGPTTTGAVPKSAKTGDAAAAKPTRAGADTPPGRGEPLGKSSRAPLAILPPPAKSETTAAATAAPPPAAEPPAPAPPVRVVTATPPTPPAPAAEAPPSAGGPAVAIDLGGFRTLASLRRAWGDMAMRSGEVTKGLEPLARLRETDSGMEARLLAGPFVDQTEAARVCLRLKASGAPCAITTYSGQPIAGLR